MKRLIFYTLFAVLFIGSCSKEKEEKMILDAPVIYSISPLEGRPGTTVTIEGENFSRLRVDNKVFFNGVAAEIIHFNETTIHAKAPEGSEDGPVEVEVIGKKAEGSDFHFIQPPAPTGEKVVVKILSFGGHATANAAANNLIPYYTDLAKELDVDFLMARETDSVTNRSGKVDRPKIISEQSGLPYFQFSRLLPNDYQNGAYGIAVYSKHPIVKQFSTDLGDNRTLSFIQVQFTEKSQIALAGVQLEDVLAQQVKRNNQAARLNAALDDVMVPTILAGGVFLLKQNPLEDETFQILEDGDFVSGCTSCDWTSVSGTTDVIADFIAYRWVREAKVIKYENLPTGPGSNRDPVYMEIEFTL